MRFVEFPFELSSCSEAPLRTSKEPAEVSAPLSERSSFPPAMTTGPDGDWFDWRASVPAPVLVRALLPVIAPAWVSVSLSEGTSKVPPPPAPSATGLGDWNVPAAESVPPLRATGFAGEPSLPAAATVSFPPVLTVIPPDALPVPTRMAAALTWMGVATTPLTSKVPSVVSSRSIVAL
jgi:hypothetical protein